MSPELSLLRLFVRDKDHFTKYHGITSKLIFDKEIEVLYKLIAAYYTKYGTHSYIGSDELTSFFNLQYPTIKDKDLYTDLIDSIFFLDVSDSVIKDIISALVEKDYSNRIIDKLTPVLTENKTNILETIEEDLREYTNVFATSLDDENFFVEDSLQEILEKNITGDGIEWRLTCLQDALGSLRGGVLGHIAARPETGKTSFLASEISYFASQLSESECGLWINNEEKGSKVKLRLFNSILNSNTDKIVNNIDAAVDLFDKRGGNKIKIRDSAYVSLDDIRSMIKRYTPRFVVVDQGDKIKFAGAHRLDTPIMLKELYKQFREIAKEFDTPVITVGQAGFEAHGKKWIDESMLDYSRTGKAAEMDFIVCIGKTLGEEGANLRYLNVCKNKMTGRHPRLTVNFNEETARYEDL